MTTEAATDPASAGSDSVQPSTELNAPYDPDFDGEPLAADAETSDEGIDPESEPDEGGDTPAQESEESDQPSGETDAETETEETSPVEMTVPDDALVTLADGQKVKFKDLKESPMLKADYTRSKQELGNQRRTVGEQATRIQNVTEALVNFLAEQIPAEPSHALALQDPAQYVQQKAFYDAQVARIQGLLEQSTQAKAVGDQLTVEQRETRLRESNDALLSALPHLRDPKKRQEFSQSAWNAARHIGFSAEELRSSDTDHRLMILGYYADKGLRAEQAQKKVAQKVQAAPSATPAKRAQQKGDPKAFQNINAMRRLAQTGSLKDALSIDFE